MARTVRNQIQVSIQLRRPSYVQITRELLLQFLYYRASTGEDPPGVKIGVIEWRKDPGRVYVYDDDDTITEVLRRALDQFGASVFVFQTPVGREAIEE